LKLFLKIERLYNLFLNLLDAFTAFMVFGIMILITTDVFARSLFNHPFQGVSEIVSSCIIILCFFEIPYCLMKGSHVRSTIIYDKVGPRVKACIDLLCCILGIIAFSFIIMSSWKNLLHAIEIQDVEIAGSVRISTIPGRFSIVFGSAAMVVEYFFLMVHYFLKIAKPELDMNKNSEFNIDMNAS
jgi:TRAP-type C4-dicarboxylate transport system permease small subunit